MKMLGRRGFLQRLGGMAAAIPSTVGICSPAVASQHRRRITQSELEAALDLHSYWIEGDSRGMRAIFNNCDLSGRDFFSDRMEVIHLRGSDFTDADLSGITGNEVSFNWSSLQSAQLSWSHLKLPSFCSATLRRARCDSVLWGWPSETSFQIPARIDGWLPQATFINTDLSFTSFDEARVMGFFSETRFTNASLRDTDLSYSHIAFDTFFSGSELLRTKFHRASMNAAHFRFAHLTEVDFSFADVGSKCTWPQGLAQP